MVTGTNTVLRALDALRVTRTRNASRQHSNGWRVRQKAKDGGTRLKFELHKLSPAIAGVLLTGMRIGDNSALRSQSRSPISNSGPNYSAREGPVYRVDSGARRDRHNKKETALPDQDPSWASLPRRPLRGWQAQLHGVP